MLNEKGFDDWSGEYDQSIDKHSTRYPFDGYYNVLSFVHELVAADKGVDILDIGVGTGLLTQELYKQGAQIYGVDFSHKMLELAAQKMPHAVFYHYDFKYGLPKELKTKRFDYIVSSYAFHHLNPQEAIACIQTLRNHLKTAGQIIIADVAFETEEKLQACRAMVGPYWDDDEFYLTADDVQSQLQKTNASVRYTQVSSCAGVFEISESRQTP